MYGINEAIPGPRWKALFDATWPSYRAWYLQDGVERRPGLTTARAMLVRHMPELVATWEALVELTGKDEVAARMLTMWDTPAFLPGCSQAVLTGEHPGLVRNYDYSPELFEWVSYSSAFTGRKVIGTGDCLWGLLDGMNEDGLVVSLTFGGRRGYGPGFAVPLVVRYLLEVATTVEEAKTVLARIPVSMCYNLTLTGRSGEVATAFVAPGMDPEFSDAAVATNHRGTVPEDPQHAHNFRSVERQQHLLSLLDTQPDLERLTEEFLTTPLYSRDYRGAFGTVYTAVYRPHEGSVEYRWPDTTFRRTFECSDDTVSVLLQQAPPAA
jgi:predicted choloylglycine hydrolase